MEIRWSSGALARLEAIGDFIAKDAPERAAFFEDRLLESVERLAEFPLSGSYVPENPAYRQVVLEGYRVIYHVALNGIEVVTIISSGLDGERLLRRSLAKLKKRK